MTGTCAWLAPIAGVALAAACAGEPTAPPPGATCESVAAATLELPPPPALLAARRQRLASQLGDGVLVLAAGSPNPDPHNEGLRGDANLFYLAGLDIPDSWLVILVRAGRVDSTLLFLPEAREDGPVSAAAVTGASAVRCAGAFHGYLQHLLATWPPLHLHPDNAATSDPAVLAIRAATNVSVRDLREPLAALRMVKDTAELARLRQAAFITARAIVRAVSVIRPGNGEADVAAAIAAGFLELGAPRASFPSIVASGSNALTLHYSMNNRSFSGDELVLMDVGAEFGRYAGDVTRTFPVSGRFSARQRELYGLVLGALQEATAAVRSGVTMRQLDGVAREYLRAHSGTRCGSQACDAFFVHALSHSLGLNVHDPAGYDTPLEPGAVITVEPGIYLAGEGIGIRIEDDVVVTVDGPEVLSGAVPRTIEEIEALFGGRSGGAPVQLPARRGILRQVP